jgi:hypothetical protein
MHHQPSSNLGWRRVLAMVVAGVPAWAGAQASAGANAGVAPDTFYGVINLASEVGAFALNERGQAMFASYTFLREKSGFFDGDRVRDIGSFGANSTRARGLNNLGAVVGLADTGKPYPDGSPAFIWTAEGGLRALGGIGSANARAINDQREIVGATYGARYTFNALRWNADGSLLRLGRPEALQSVASAINKHGVSTGSESVGADFSPIHAMVWDRDGKPTDLGTVGGSFAEGRYINARNEVVGTAYTSDFYGRRGFFWSRASGVVPLPGLVEDMTGLNNRGLAVGNTRADQGGKAFQWSLGQGLVPLPLGSAVYGEVRGISDAGDMVGRITPDDADRRALRAARWPGLAAPIDLNKRLHRAPAGLVLESADAINSDGVILAQSNAGLMMLRPERRGTDAPVLGPLKNFPFFIGVGQQLALGVSFVDNDGAQTHTASAEWGDGCPSPAPTVSESGGVGVVTLQHQFCSLGAFSVAVRVADSGGRQTEVQRNFFVETPGMAALRGQGALMADGHPRGRTPLRFLLWAPLEAGAAGNARGAQPVVDLSGPFHFRSERVDSARANGRQARVEGSGRLDGRDGYRFVLDALAGAAGQSRLRVRLTHADPVSGAEVVDYDNGAVMPSAGADRTAVAQGELTLR